MKCLGTGLSGLIGSRIIELLSPQLEFTDLSLDTGVDITDRHVVFTNISQSDASWILHLAAKTDVDACEKDKALGVEGNAWRINVKGTSNIVEAAQKFKKQVLYISTDFVFSGTKDFYTEDDPPAPINWYGVTKFEGEKIVLDVPSNIVVRLAYPYLAKCEVKKDFLHGIALRLDQKQKIYALTDHYFTPTFVDDIVKALKLLIKKGSAGIFHVVGQSFTTPYEAGREFAQKFGYDPSLIQPIERKTYFAGRASRPYKLRLKNDKITSLGAKMSTFSQGLDIIKKQGFII